MRGTKISQLTSVLNKKASESVFSNILQFLTICQLSTDFQLNIRSWSWASIISVIICKYWCSTNKIQQFCLVAHKLLCSLFYASLHSIFYTIYFREEGIRMVNTLSRPDLRKVDFGSGNLFWMSQTVPINTYGHCPHFLWHLTYLISETLYSYLW